MQLSRGWKTAPPLLTGEAENQPLPFHLFRVMLTQPGICHATAIRSAYGADVQRAAEVLDLQPRFARC
jgi:hypothetical protein